VGEAYGIMRGAMVLLADVSKKGGVDTDRETIVVKCLDGNTHTYTRRQRTEC
jgi:hypothetical protein